MATIIDIAKHAGVSVATVSRTFNHPAKVHPKTLEKVQRGIAELGYSRNALARGLRQMRSQTVIVIVPQIQNPFFSGVVQGIENIAHDNDFKVLIGETQEKQERLDYYAAMVASRFADGLILLGSLLPSEVASALHGGGGAPPLPLVLACERYDQLQCPHVAIDNEAAAYQAVRHLVEQGCRRIATISGPLSNTLGQDRLQGYRRALSEAGLSLGDDLIAEGDFTLESGHTAMQRFLTRPERPDGIFCGNDEMAIGAQHAIRLAGLSVPGDFAIVGFDDIRFAEFMDPPLSTVRQPTREIGEAAMKLMIGLLEDEPVEARELILPHELIVRASTRRSS